MADTSKAFSVLTVLIIVGITAVVGMNVAGMAPTQDQFDETRSHLEDYCQEAYGPDAEVYLANDAFFANHNGFHCTSDEGTTHLNQIPEETWEQYKAGEVSAEYVRRNLEPGPGLLPYDALAPAAGITLGLGVVVYGLQSWRGDEP